MILEYITTPLDGNAWEEWCNSCYRLRYQTDNYQRIPAAYQGDGGIEGFTQSGIVYQCYYPEKKYTDNELYEKQRDKLTKDIGKLLKPSYKDTLERIGVPPITEWHFVIPYYRDRRILEHANAKHLEVQDKRNSSPKDFTHISNKFKIFIKEADDFQIEISQIIRGRLTDSKISIIAKTKTFKWSDCPSDKVKHIQRKIKAVIQPEHDNDEDYVGVVDTYIQYYMRGIESLHMLQINFSELYEQLYSLEQACRLEVTTKTRMNRQQDNLTVFEAILGDFGSKLTEEFGDYFNAASIIELKNDMVGAWLADCPMQFRSV